MSRLKNVDLVFLYFLFHFIFCSIYFHFSIFRTLGLGLEVISHTVTLVTADGVVIIIITGLEEKEVEGSGIK